LFAGVGAAILPNPGGLFLGIVRFQSAVKQHLSRVRLTGVPGDARCTCVDNRRRRWISAFRFSTERCPVTTLCD